jgi:adenylate cyclase
MDGVNITQVYLATEPSIRVRLIERSYQEPKAKLTIKGPGLLTRKEYEYDIPYEQGLEMMKFCKTGLKKRRFRYIAEDNHIWDIDVFYNLDLIVAEIELSSEDEEFVKPSWVAKEVTMDPQYSNVNLVSTVW